MQARCAVVSLPLDLPIDYKFLYKDKIEDVMITTNQLGTLFKQGYLTDGAGRPVDTWNHGTGMHNVIVSEYDITQHNWT